MKSQVDLFSIFGIKVRMHLTFLFLLLYFFSVMGIWGVGLVIAIFACVLMHEISHCLVAKRYGILTRDILLLPIGGIARMSRISKNPKEEFAIAIAGPISNFVLAFILYCFLKVMSGSQFFLQIIFSTPEGSIIFAGLVYLIQINIALGGFNLIPAFPMDGGRIFRAALACFYDYAKATKIAVFVGRIFSALFVAYGLFAGRFILAIIGAFIYMASHGEYQVVAASEKEAQIDRMKT